MRAISKIILKTTAAAIVASCFASGCATSAPTMTPAPAPRTVELGVAVKDVDIKQKSLRHHYKFELPEEGLVTVSLSWRDSDGVDRMIVHGGAGIQDTVLASGRQEATFVRTAYRGQYYVEIVPGQYNTSYDLKVEFAKRRGSGAIKVTPR